MRCLKLMVVAVAAYLVGCGAPAEQVEKVAPAGPPPAKAMLEGVAASGELGSGAQEIRSALDKESDPAKKEALLKDMDALEKAATPDEVKAKAKEMADKL